MDGKFLYNWKETNLANLTSFVIGGDWGYAQEDIIEDTSLAYCIRGNEIKEWERDKGKTATIRRIKNSSIEKRKLQKGDILVEISGGGPDQPVGRTIYIDEESLKNRSGYPTVCTNFFRLVRLFDTINSKYINYYLHYFYLKGGTIKMQGGSNNLRNLRFKEYLQSSIPLPPLTEQNRIADKLDTLFGQLSIIQKALEHIPELIKNFRQQVLTFAVTGKLTEEWRKGKNLTKWKAELASECCEKVQSGGTPKGGKFEKSGIPFLKVYNIVHNTIDFISNPQYVSRDIHSSQIKKSISYPGDVIMNIVGPPLNKVAIIPNTYAEWNINQAITLFRPKDYLNNKFLYYFFCEGTPVNRLVNQTRGVVGQINISLTQCRNFLIPIPPIQEQREIVKIIDSLFKKIETIEQQYNALKAKIEKLPQALLNKAFRGELVDQLPSDGSAENLLKEIEQFKRSIKKK